MEEKLLQFGNRKLPTTIGIFNLPSDETCPGSTAYCRQVCYARKAAKMYKNVNPYRARMYEISKKEDFVSIMTLFITKSKRKIIRMHESGDYYSQDYLNKWINIAENLPEVIFYAYTKSYMFDFSKRPGNFVVRLSIDKTSTQEALDKTKLFDGIAETIDKDATSTMFVCPGSCKTCNYCLAPGLDVAFHLH